MRVWHLVGTSFLCVLLAIFALGAQSATLKSTVNDSLITARVKSQLVRNESTKATSVNVETTEGIVKLTGVMDSLKEALIAVKIAQSTDGVDDVDVSNLHVQAKEKINRKELLDNFTTAKVQGFLEREKPIATEGDSLNRLTLSTRNGDVMLGGQINSQSDLDKIIQKVIQVKGVKKVNSNVVVTHDQQGN